MQVAIDFTGHPFLVAFCQKGRNEAQTGSGVWDDGRHAGTLFEFAVDAVVAVGGTQAYALCCGRIEHREAIWHVVFGPLRPLERIGRPPLDRLLEQSLCLDPVRRIEEGADALGDRRFLVDARDVGLGILLSIERATLLWQRCAKWLAAPP